jgi:hypothetical protein
MVRSDPPRLRRSLTVAGHPGISWSIVCDAVVAPPVDPDIVAQRLARAWPGDGHLGPIPAVQPVAAEEWRSSLQDAADRPFAEGSPRCRVLIGTTDTTRVAVAAHHATLDGLGLIALLGAALGVSLGTGARGIEPGHSPGTGSVEYGIRRLIEALADPPARIAPDHGSRRAGGDHLVRIELTRPAGTAALVTAAASAVRGWNRDHGVGPGRVMMAVGAALGPGSAPVIGRQSTWLRLELPDGDIQDVRELLRVAAPEPPPPTAMLRAARLTGLAGALDGRTGSTLLVSHLGRLTSGPVRSAAFYPSAHGRSGVSIGGIGVGAGTTLTLRARRADYSWTAAEELLARVVAELERPARG